jgi:aryl-alcohol dehydrogenase-like predicted oxidoreductase
LNEEGRKQQNKLRELTLLATTFDCTVAQLAIGNIQSYNSLIQLNPFFSAWCLKNENVHCVLLGATSVEQLYENIHSLHVRIFYLFSKYFSFF